MPLDKNPNPADRLAKPEGSSDIAVERRRRNSCGFAEGKEARVENRSACGRFLPQAKEGKRNSLFYFHGFNSAIPEDISTSPKISAVADFCRCTGRAFRPLNIDYRKAEQHSREILDLVPTDVERVIFCGASMGGWFARVMQLLLARQRPELPVEAVIFNPAFNLAEFSHHLEGHQHNYVTLEEYEFRREHSEQLIRLEQSVNYHADLPLWVYVDAEDEVINAEWSQKWHAGISRFVSFPGGSHSFEHAREALDDFEPGCWNRVGQ